MKHKWEIIPRGKKTKYYICERCGLKISAFLLKDANKYEPNCDFLNKEKNVK